MIRAAKTRLAGLLVLEPTVHADSRGFFLETYRRDELEPLGITSEFVQENHSRSSGGTIRGLHFQVEGGQAKLVRVAVGSVFDVAVDVRPSSPTFGQWESFVLDDLRHAQLFVPVGFAHGFCALGETADVVYKVDSYYDPAAERGIRWDDPALDIPWPVAEPIVSERDRRNPTLAEIREQLPTSW